MSGSTDLAHDLRHERDVAIKVGWRSGTPPP